MATFDMSKASAIITTSPTPILDALGVQYGLPTCLLDLAKEALAAFPSPILNNMNSGIQAGKSKADELTKEITRRVFLDTGIVEYDSTLGRFVFVSSSSNKGVEQNMLQSMNNMGGLGTILGFGAQAWLIGEKISEQIDSIKNCIDKVSSYDALQKGPSAYADKLVGFSITDPTTGEPVEFTAPLPAAKAASLVYEQSKADLESAISFSSKCQSQMNIIASITKCRLQNPIECPEPCFWGDLTDENGQTLSNLLSGTDFCVMNGINADAEGNPILPVLAGFDPYTDILTATGLLPPISKGGQFLFSKTGIYYDSYGGGIDLPDGCITNIVSAVYFDEEGNPYPGLGVPENSMKYLFDYNPNIGGKGECLSLRDFNGWAETIFDLDTLNESPNLMEYYDEDHFLQVLIDQRNREIYDLSGYVSDLIIEGYGEDSSRVVNQRQILYSTISDHDSKIKRRKKQIEVHVVLSNNPPPRGEIPINDFAGLDADKIAIQKSLQESLLFSTNEVSGIVLPLCPTFIKSEIEANTFVVEDLMVPTVGVGDIITSASSVSVTSGTVLSLVDKISTDGLVAVYNFLDADLVTPDSKKYLSINCATSSSYDKPAQLVASSVDSMFPSGIGLPYFRGVCNVFSGLDGNSKSAYSQNQGEGYLFSPYRPYGYASIQGGYEDIDSLFYKKSGCTFETWCCIPDLDDEDSLGWNKDSSVSALHRVVLGCENRGGIYSSTDGNWTVGPQGNTVRGLLIGFTRDTRITRGTAPSNDPASNTLEANLAFYMAPTQSINTSGVTFMSVSANTIDCVAGDAGGSGHYGLIMDCSTVAGTNSGKIGDVSSGFKLLTVTVDYASDSVSLYLNGDLMKSQSVLQTFGTEGTPNLPGLVDTSSFSYNNTYKHRLPLVASRFPPNSIGQSDFWYWDGPDLQSGLTPFTIGGGYTDGMTPVGLINAIPTTNEGMNFMGGKWGGKKSGLYGFLGSLKLYNRAITDSEALKNYNAQKGFFENIQI